MPNIATVPTSDAIPPLSDAKAFLGEYPTESITLSSRLHKVNPNTLKSSIRRDRIAKPNPSIAYGGQNKILSQYQELAVFKYVNDIYLAGFGATKPMVYGVICALKEAEQREAPSEQWFRGWLLKNKDTIKTTRTKVIPRSRVTAQDEKDIEAWFVE